MDCERVKVQQVGEWWVRGLWHDGADCCLVERCCPKVAIVARTSAGKEASSVMSRADRERARAFTEE